MNEPTVIEPVTMKDMGDCSICCLAMFLGKTYAEILTACPKRSKPLTDGLTPLQISNVARKFGVALEYDDTPDEDDIGILILERTINDDSHACMYLKGVIFHPGDGAIWTDMESYLKQYHWKVEGILRRKQ